MALVIMVFIGILIYGVFERPELALLRDAVLTLFR